MKPRSIQIANGSTKVISTRITPVSVFVRWYFASTT